MIRLSTLTALAAASFAASTAHAELIYGLTQFTGNQQQVIRVDSASPGTLIGSSVIAGTTGGEVIADIDIYPVTGALVGVGVTTGTLYNINPLTGAATVNVMPSGSIATPQDIDFNPAADRLRVASSNNGNFRVTPGTFDNAGLVAGQVTNDGTVAYAPGDVNATSAINIVGNAYTNPYNVPNAVTTLYSINTANDTLVSHSGGPAFSTINTVGALGAAVGSNVGFDVSTGTGIAYVSDGNALYTINLANGTLTPAGNLFAFASVQSIAVPEPASLALAGVAAAGLLRRRRA